MLDVRKPAIRPFALEGKFGLEREALRVTADKRMAQTPHPFPPDHPRIVRDFCENQTEINTGVHLTAAAAVAELTAINQMLIQHIARYGDTDSERVLLHLVERINHAQNHLHRALNEKERFDVLFTEIVVLAKRNKLNLLIFDGEVLYAHCNFRDTLHVCQEDDVVTFSTRALSVGRWESVPFTSLIAAKDGEIIRTSPPHGNEYIYNPDDYRLVYMDFARL